MQDVKPVADKVLDMLRELAGAIGGTAEKLWPAAVKATYADGISSLAVAAAITMILLVAWAVLWNLTKQRDGRTSFNSDAHCARIAFTVVIIILVLMTVGIGLGKGLPNVLAPEGQTLFRILGR